MKLSIFTIFSVSILLLCNGCRMFYAPRTQVLSAKPGSFSEMLDFKSIPKVKTWKTKQCSSYDRYDGFFDAGHFLRIEPGRHYVLMDVNGPGCIDRIWLTRKTLHEPYDLLIFIDGRTNPDIKTSLEQWSTGKTYPFIKPLAGTCADANHPAFFSYTPVGFTKHCKIVLTPTAPQENYEHRVTETGDEITLVFYQITYREFPAGINVKSFNKKFDTMEKQDFTKVKNCWNNTGLSPWSSLTDLKLGKFKAIMPPKQKITIFDLPGSGTIYGLHLKSSEPAVLDIEMTWDNAVKPQVSVSSAEFFASKPDMNVRGLWSGCIDGQYYCYLPMPFQQGAKISISSNAQKTTELCAEIEYRSEDVGPGDCRLYVNSYDYQLSSDGEDYVVLDVNGCGHFAGIIMTRPGHMEGDDHFFIDGEENPSIHGTGTEDFFNFAWGLAHTGSYPLHGINRDITGAPICYRFHLPAAVPFEKSLRITWEHGHFKGKGHNLHKGRYSGAVFYYKASD